MSNPLRNADLFCTLDNQQGPRMPILSQSVHLLHCLFIQYIYIYILTGRSDQVPMEYYTIG